MKIRVLAAILSIGGIFISGCSTTERFAAVGAAGVVAPMGTIRSQGDLQRYLAATAKSGSPLDALSSSARARFLSSITFNEKGITGFRYGDLQSELTARQMFDVLHLFGVERDVKLIPNLRVETPADQRVISALPFADGGGDGGGFGKDYRDYWCVSRATCNPSPTSICTSNC